MAITSFEERLSDRLNALESKFESLVAQDKPGSLNVGAGRIPFGGSTGVLTDSADLLWDNTAKKLTINTGNDQGYIALVHDSKGVTDTDATNPRFGNVFQQSFNPGGTQLTNAKFAVVNRAILSGSGGSSGSGAIQAVRNEVVFEQTAGTHSGIAYGIDAILRHSGAATLANSRLVRAIGILSGAGSLTELRNFFADSPGVSGAGTIGTSIGLYIARQKIASGVSVGYGVYQVDGNDINLFNGATTFDLSVVSNQGGIHTRGSNAGFVFRDRTTNTPDWQWYSSGGGASSFARLYDGSGDVLTVDTSGVVNIVGSYQVNGTRIATVRQTGWTLATGTLSRATFDTATVTTAQLAQRVAALIDDLHATNGHGLIGT